MTLTKLTLVGLALFAPHLFADNFEIVDGTATVTGEPSLSQSQARENWRAACEKWKIETKEFNKDDHIMAMSCESPSCNDDVGNITCSSTAIYKVKTAGTRVQPTPPPPPPAPVQTVETVRVVESAPPPVIVETVPVPRPGFIWIGGYWGWHHHMRHWYGGHWEARHGYWHRW